MATLIRSRGPTLRSATLLAVFFGFLLLVYAAATVGTALHNRPLSRVSVLEISSFCLWGALNLIASWALYRRRSWAIPVYGASWLFNVTGLLALGLTSHSKPTWYLLLVAGGMAYLAVLLVARARTELQCPARPTHAQVTEFGRSDRLPRFTWPRFAFVAALALAIDGLLALSAWEANDIGGACALAVFAFSLVSFMTYRFDRLRAAAAAGQLVPQRYWVDPRRYIIGPTGPFVMWLACTLCVMLGLTIFFALRGR